MYQGPTTVDANESRPSNPANTLIVSTLIVFMIMLFTGHVPSL